MHMIRPRDAPDSSTWCTCLVHVLLRIRSRDAQEPIHVMHKIRSRDAQVCPRDKHKPLS